MQCHKITLLALELTQALACSLFFFSHSLECISCAVKKCVISLSKPLDDHQPRLKWFKEVDGFGGGEDVWSHYD